MKALKRNQTPFWYALFDHTDLTDGNGHYTGLPTNAYKAPVKCRGYISPARGAAQVEVFGTNTSFDRTIYLDDPNTPIDENTVLFLDGDPTAQVAAADIGSADAATVGGGLRYDHVVKSVARDLNTALIAIERVRK